MELRQLKQFVAVAEHLSFRRAAEHLHMAQPPLSIAIAKLEAELGAGLFRRHHRRIDLTAAGHAALQAAQRCLANAQDVGAMARSAERGEIGTLRIGFVGSATYALLPRLLPRFRKHYPDVEIILREAINVEMLPELESEKLDIGIVRVPTYQPHALEFQVCERDVFKVAMRADHPLAKRRRLSLTTLAHEPLIGYGLAKVPGMQALVALAFQSVGLMPRITQEAFQVQTLLSLVKSGMGIALVPGISEHNMPDGVVLRPIADLPASAALGLAITSRVDNHNPAVLRFKEFAAELSTAATR